MRKMSKNGFFLLFIFSIFVAFLLGLFAYKSLFSNETTNYEKSAIRDYIDYVKINSKQQFYEENKYERRAVTINVVAVTNEGKGVVGKAIVELINNGKGRIFANTHPFIDVDLQDSIEKALVYALNYSKRNIKNYDIAVSFDIGSSKLVGGYSAGAALTIAFIALLTNKKIRDDFTITGTIEKDGSIGNVSGIIEKIDAASKANIKIMAIPKSQRYLTYYEPIIERKDLGFMYIENVRYVAKTLDLVEYAESKGIKLIPVENINEILNYAFEKN